MNRNAFSLIELIIVTAIVAVLAGMMIPAVQQAREAASRAQCENNLRQIAMAVHMYHDREKNFPYDWDLPYVAVAFTNTTPRFYAVPSSPTLSFPDCGSIFVVLLPFLDNTTLTAQDADGVNGTAPPLSMYLCPSRRSVAAGARTDYGPAQRPWGFENGAYPFSFDGSSAGPSVGWPNLLPNSPNPSSPGQWLTVLGSWPTNASPIRFNDVITLRRVNKADGASNTLLLAHKGVAPAYYDGSGPNDQGYANLGNYWEHKRFGGGLWRDSNSLKVGVGNNTPNSHQVLTSPHLNSMPCIFVDGSVRSVPYSTPGDVLWKLWSFNDGNPVTAP